MYKNVGIHWQFQNERYPFLLTLSLLKNIYMILIYCSSYKNETTRNDMKKPKIKKNASLITNAKIGKFLTFFGKKKGQQRTQCGILCMV